jgi:hypothetical protein
MKHIDLQDLLLAGGLISLESGVAILSRPAALIMGGLICLFFVLLIEHAKAKTARRREK